MHAYKKSPVAIHGGFIVFPPEPWRLGKELVLSTDEISKAFPFGRNHVSQTRTVGHPLS